MSNFNYCITSFSQLLPQKVQRSYDVRWENIIDYHKSAHYLKKLLSYVVLKLMYCLVISLFPVKT